MGTASGPVIRSIWNHIRDYTNFNTNFLCFPNSNRVIRVELKDEERIVIDHVWNKYKHFSAVELSNMTHQPGTPWANAYFGIGRNAQLQNDDIRQHFIELVLAGRATG